MTPISPSVHTSLAQPGSPPRLGSSFQNEGQFHGHPIFRDLSVAHALSVSLKAMNKDGGDDAITVPGGESRSVNFVSSDLVAITVWTS
jgi:hypothetical protein